MKSRSVLFAFIVTSLVILGVVEYKKRTSSEDETSVGFSQPENAPAKAPLKTTKGQPNATVVETNSNVVEQKSNGFTAEEQALIDEAMADLSKSEYLDMENIRPSILKHPDGTLSVYFKQSHEEAVGTTKKFLARTSVQHSKRNFEKILGKNDPRLQQLNSITASIVERGTKLSTYERMLSNHQIPLSNEDKELAKQLVNEYADNLRNLLSADELDKFQNLKLEEVNRSRISSIEATARNLILETDNLSDHQESEINRLAQELKAQITLDSLPLGSQIGDMSLVCCPFDTYNNEARKTFNDQVLALLTPEQRRLLEGRYLSN